MNVWYITMLFPVESFANTEVRALRNSGIDVSVHCLHNAKRVNDVRLEDLGLGGTKVTYSSYLAVISGLLTGITRPWLFFLFLFWIFRCTWNQPLHLAKCLFLTPRILDIFRCIGKERPEVVHFFWGHYPSLVGYLVHKAFPKIVISDFLGAYDLMLRKNTCSTKVAQIADILWTHSYCNVSDIESLGVSKERIIVNHRGIDLSNIKAIDIKKIKRRIITASRLTKAKCVDAVLRTFKEVRKNWPDASLVVLGDGPEREKLEDLATNLKIDKSVVFMGHVEHEKVYHEILKSEIFVFMSKSLSERLPNVVKEAMASRCLCIVTETPGIEELIENGKNGYVVPWDVNVVAERINQLFASQAPCKDMLDDAYNHICANFNVKNSAMTYKIKWEGMAASKNKINLDSNF